MPTEDITPEDARRALSEVSAREQGSAARLDWPLWRELALSGCASGLIVTALAPRPFDVLALAALCGAIFWLLRDYMSRPVWVSGWRRGRTLPLTVAFAAGFLALYAAGFAGYRATGDWWIPAATSVAAFIGFTVFNRVWMAVWRAEVREGQA